MLLIRDDHTLLVSAPCVWTDPCALCPPPLQAFAAMLGALGPAGIAISQNGTAVAGLLAYHVVPAVALSTDLRNGQVLPTLVPDANATLTVSINGTSVRIIALGSSANVVTANVRAGNAVAHVIDAVLLPTPVPTAGRR